MEKYAVIKLGGKQFMVEEGTQFRVERQKALNPEVLLFSDGKKILVGEPVLSEITVKMEFVEQDTKAPKSFGSSTADQYCEGNFHWIEYQGCKSRSAC